MKNSYILNDAVTFDDLIKSNESRRIKNAEL